MSLPTPTLLPQRVAHTQLAADVAVSTINLEHQPGYAAELVGPMPYETQVRGGPHHELTHRYATRAAALAGHYQVVAELAEELVDAGDGELL